MVASAEQIARSSEAGVPCSCADELVEAASSRNSRSSGGSAVCAADTAVHNHGRVNCGLLGEVALC